MHFKKFYLSPTFVLWIILCYLLHSFEEGILLYLFTLIHEACHIFVGKLFHIPLKKMTLNYFGCTAELDNLDYRPLYQQVILYLAGPLSVFISAALLFLCKEISLITLYQYERWMNLNIAVFAFNMLPLYPLDGGRILDLALKKFYPVNESIRLRNFYSFVSLLIALPFLLIKNEHLFAILLLIAILSCILFPDREYERYLRYRLIQNHDFPENISANATIYHFNTNYYVHEGTVLDEEQLLTKLLIQNTPRSRLNFIYNKFKKVK